MALVVEADGVAAADDQHTRNSSTARCFEDLVSAVDVVVQQVGEAGLKWDTREVHHRSDTR